MTVDTQDLIWQQLKPGHWERGVDEAERFYSCLAKRYQGTGRMFFAITGHVSIQSTVPDGCDGAEWEIRLENALRRAWLLLRHSQPAVASWIEWNPQQHRLVKIYQAIPELQKPGLESDWLNETFRVVSGLISGQQFCNSDPPAPRMPTLFVIKPKTKSEQDATRRVRTDLVIRSPHDIMDGIGTLHLLDTFLKFVSTVLKSDSSYELPDFGDEWTKLNPPLRLALGLPSTPSQQIIDLYQEITAQNASLQENMDMITMPFKHGALKPGKHQRVETRMSAEKTGKLLAVCKGMGVSVTHAYHAAAAVTLSRLQQRGPTERLARYINYGLINLRVACQDPYSSPDYAASVYHTVSPHSLIIEMTVPAASDGEENSTITAKQVEEFKHVLTIVKSFYDEVRKDQNLPQMSPLIWQKATPQYIWGALESLTVPPPSKTPSVSISSMGIIDKILQPQHDSFAVYDPWVTGEELGNGLGLFLGTFRDELSLSAAFNEAWHDEEEVLHFIRKCEDIVSAALGTSHLA